MASFKALNIESDDESDIVIDDTKEIQIEEALKLYQIAIRYHSEGPASFEQAAKAYQELFASEIFRYPESQSELRRIELYGPLSDGDLSWEDINDTDLLNLNSFDIGSSTLPQILHLSHKNYAQFKLDSLAARLDSLQASVQLILSDAAEALDHFVTALDKDDTDAELWKNTAAVASLLDSKRIARLCLEASLDKDDEGAQAVLNIPSFEDSIARDKLQHMVVELDDHLASMQSARTSQHNRMLLRRLATTVDKFQELVAKIARTKTTSRSIAQVQSPHSLSVAMPKTWLELGELILRTKQDEDMFACRQTRSTIWHFDLPSASTSYLTPPQDADVMESYDNESSATMTVPHDLAVTVDFQFPGLASGRLPLRIDTSASNDGSDTVQPTSAISEAGSKSAETSLPTRKRSGDTAGLADDGEEGRSRSKRIRARDSLADPVESKQALREANVQWEYDQHLRETQAADDWLYETVGPMFARIGVGCFETIKQTKALLGAEPELTTDALPDSIVEAQRALYAFLQDYDERTAHSLMHAGEKNNVGRVGHARGPSIAPHQSKSIPSDAVLSNEGLFDFLENENGKHTTFTQVAVDFVLALMCPGAFPGHDESSYIAHIWTEQLKSVLVRSIVAFDSELFKLATDAYDGLHVDHDAKQYNMIRGWLQNIFEMHLDIYSLIRRKDSGVDMDTIGTQAQRLDRWFELLREVSHVDSINDDEALNIRYLWSSTFYLAGLQDISQERVLAYQQDLREEILKFDQTIKLVNNAVISDISLQTIDQEISQLTTKDFFDKVSSMKDDNPAALIEMIEPLLEAVEARRLAPDDYDLTTSSVPPELVLFLENSGPASIMQLWRRLLDAYIAIGYKPMVVRTLFRVMRLAIGQIEDNNLANIEPTERVAAILPTLRLVQRLTADILQTLQKPEDAFECMDDDDINGAVMLYDKVLRMLQVFNVFEDPIRIGKTHAPALPNGTIVPLWKGLSKLFHEMQLQVWTVLYSLLKEAMNQDDELFLTPHEDKFEFLRTLHRNLGIREICGGLNRTFIRMIRDEFSKLTHIEGYDSEQAQVLYDLYGLNCFLKPEYELMEHKCVNDASLDRDSAFEAVDMLLIQASRVPIKDLVRHTLKDAIDKVHGALNRKKPTDAIIRNRDAIRNYLRAPINPLEVFRSFRGEGNVLYATTVPEDDAILAAKGWYYLMGHIALVKFRTSKRTSQTPTDDIDIAIAFFMQELEWSTANWETWFRLGQAYETKLGESVAWSAEKLNSNMTEIIQLQRAVIHCFSMAIALAFRSAEPSPELTEKMTELYTEFATRIYSSSRAPFSMLVFTSDIPERYLSSRQGIEKQKFFEPLSQYAAWKLARALFQRALLGNPQSWLLHYNLAKCLWKMYSARGHASQPTTQDIFSALYQAIELMPKKDTRDTKRDPILEPHYKLVSIVHKLVLKDNITLAAAKDALDQTYFAAKVEFPESKDGWTEYMLRVVKTIRAADKSNWHHRMIVRSARLIFDDLRQPDKIERAASARHELTQQLFTKTMVLQVWRPEAERPGRHFVYCERYTRFFVKLLEILKDRASLDLLARRVRRRTHEIFEHSLVWQDIISTYLRLLRAQAGVAEGLEISTFSNIFHEDFLQRKEPLEKWMQKQEAGKNEVLDVLREVLELKKINQNLMKTGPMDDLIGDTYANLFNTVGRQLLDDDKREQMQREAAKPPPPPEPVQPPRNVMNLAHMMNTEPAPPVSAPVVDLTVDADAITKRKAGVGRREIRTAADSCAYKAPSTSGSARHSVSSESAQPAVAVKSEAEQEPAIPERAESIVGSIDDDADDESELSGPDEGEDTVMDDAVEKPSAPSAFATISDGNAADGSVTAEGTPAPETTTL